MTRNRIVVAMLLALIPMGWTPLAALALTPIASPTPMATATPPAVVEIALRFDADIFTWPALEGAASYRLTGEASVLRVNAADPFCTPPTVRDNRSVTLDGNLRADQLSYRIPLPEIAPPDTWYVSGYSVMLVATDGSGRAIGSAGQGFVGETFCGRSPTPLPEPITVGNCEIPAGYREVTTQAAVEHGQRVFVDPGGGYYIYVRRDASCVYLAAMLPAPEFAPDGPLGTSGFAGDPPPGLTLPPTGAGGLMDDREGVLLGLVATIGIAGSAMVASGVRRRVR